MQNIDLNRVARIALLALLILLPLHAPITTLLISSGFPEELTEVWKELLLVVISLVAIFVMRDQLLDVYRRLFKKKAIVLTALFALVWWAASFVLSPVDVTPRLVSAVIYARIGLAIFVGWAASRLKLVSGTELKWLLIWAAGVVGIFGVLQATILPDDILSSIGYQEGIIEPYQLVDEDPDRVRIISTLRGPNPLGWFAGFILPVLAGFTLRAKSRKQKIGLGLIAAALLTALIASYSRSGLLVLAVATTLFAATTISRQHLPKLLAVAALLVIGLSSVFLTNSELRNEVLFHDSASVSNETADSQRFGSIANNFTKSHTEPFGHGLGTAGPAAFFDDSGQAIVTESFFNQISYEIGLIWSIAGYALLGFTAFGFLRTTELASKAVGAGLAGLAVVSLIAPVFTDSIVTIIAFVLAGFYLNKLKRRAAN